MRKLLVIFTLLFLTCTGTVQATNELDGKSLLCRKMQHHPLQHREITRGLVFQEGKVIVYGIEGLSTSVMYTSLYRLVGTYLVQWKYKIKENGWGHELNRETLKTNLDGQCAISSNAEIFQVLDEIIATAKKKNKI